MLLLAYVTQAQVKEVIYGDTAYMKEVEPGRYYIKVFDLKPNLPDGTYWVYSNEFYEQTGKEWLRIMATYKNGFKNGRAVKYTNPNGGIFYVTNYSNGMLSGKAKEVHLKGKDSIVVESGFYADNMKSGRWEYYYYNGKKRTLRKVENYTKGVLDGLVAIYNKRGALTSIEEYKNGELISVKKQ